MRALPLLWRARGDIRIHSSSRCEGVLARPVGLLLAGQPGLLLLEPRRVVALPGDARAPVELEDPAGHVVEEVAVVGDGHHRARVVLQGPLQPGHRLGVEVVGGLVEQQEVGLGRAAAGRAPPGGARRRTGCVTSASPGGRRSASMAISKVRSRSQAPAASILSCSSACSASSLSKSASGSPMAAQTSLKRSTSALASPTPSDTLPGTSLVGSSWGSWARKPTVKPGVRRASPVKPSSSPAMICSSEDFPEPLAPMTPILAPG